MDKLNRRRHIVSKWLKTKALLSDKSLAKYIPDTRKLTKESLKEMLDEYGMVYIKPNSGTYGIGVMRVERLVKEEKTIFQYQSGTKIRTFSDYEDMYTSIQKLTKKRLYLAQKGIHLLKYNNRRFDLRVMVQQSPDKRWVSTGVLSRVAAPGKIVTNFHNGGQIKSVETVLANHAADSEKKQLMADLQKLGLSVARQLHSRYPGIKELGLDVALDAKLHPWILEVNTCPDLFIFRRLKDKRMFGRIFKYAKAYGRL